MLVMAKFVNEVPTQQLSYSFSEIGPEMNLWDDVIYPMFHFTWR